MLRKQATPKRNERCWCGSGKKFKYCCLIPPMTQPQRVMQYIDSGEEAVRYVISNSRGTGFFSTKEGKIIVFKNRAEAFAIATLPEFENQEPGEINVAGVGATKWQHLQEKLPFIEVDGVEDAMAFVKERIEYMQQQLQEQEAAPPIPEEPEQA
ncbi:MAG: SEC-C domain-containing protein [Alphaproteobacteria bacterium]|nr:SEC-C domain-containing protein [Alphaproteobacteria bacterium]NDG03987.1 SEC-C domain-containing protein [Alphaproteobacteria bacterium]